MSDLPALLAHARNDPPRARRVQDGNPPARQGLAAAAEAGLRRGDGEVLAGYYKAFALACGPCWLCKTCGAARRGGGPAACKHPDLARPSMEAAGIDVYATARAAGLPIEVVTLQQCPQNHYVLVLVE